METLTLEGAQEPQANAASPRLAYLSVMGPASADECYERNNTVQVADRPRQALTAPQEKCLNLPGLFRTWTRIRFHVYFRRHFCDRRC